MYNWPPLKNCAGSNRVSNHCALRLGHLQAFVNVGSVSFLACLPLIEPDISAVLALDERCLGGLWTRSGYKREIDSDCSDLWVLVASQTAEALHQRQAIATPQPTVTRASTAWATEPLKHNLQPTDRPQKPYLAAIDPTDTYAYEHPIHLIGVGCLWAVLDEAHITTLAIEPSYQGQKLGQFLLTELLLGGHRRGLGRATLEVRASNQKALKLYQKFGFREAGQRRRYYSNGENARILWRSGLQESEFLEEIEKARKKAIAHLTKNCAYSFFFH